MSRRLQHPELRDLARRLKGQGWEWTMTKNGHVRWIGPNGQRVIGPSTPSDGRGVLNLKAHLRREGARL